MIQLFRHHFRFFIKALSVLTFFLALTTGVQSQGKIGDSWIVLPVIFSSPETSLGFGASAMHYFRTDTVSGTRPSNFRGVLIYTLENQLLSELPVELFFQNEYWLSFELKYFIYPFKYFGTGNKIDIEQSDSYDVTFFRSEGRALKSIGKFSYLGPSFSFTEYIDIRRTSENGILLDNTLGFKTGTVSGLGFGYILDRRNNVFCPNAGHYLEINLVNYGMHFGSNYSFTDLIVEARKYRSSGKWELAIQLYQNSQFGDVPFYNLAQLGGSTRMRGYFKGAYRDVHFSTFQYELRYKAIWRLVLSTFGSIGSVSSEPVKNHKWLASTGIGIRYEIDPKERIRIRADYAIGKGTSGFYININEAF